jgi:hypothetical protein
MLKGDANVQLLQGVQVEVFFGSLRQDHDLFRSSSSCCSCCQPPGRAFLLCARRDLALHLLVRRRPRNRQIRRGTKTRPHHVVNVSRCALVIWRVVFCISVCVCIIVLCVYIIALWFCLLCLCLYHRVICVFIILCLLFVFISSCCIWVFLYFVFVVQVPSDGAMCDLLWSDPLYQQNEPREEWLEMRW